MWCSSDESSACVGFTVYSSLFTDGPPVVTHYDISDTNSDPEVLNVDNMLAATVVKEHNNSVSKQEPLASWRTRGLLEELNADSGTNVVDWLAFGVLLKWLVLLGHIDGGLVEEGGPTLIALCDGGIHSKKLLSRSGDHFKIKLKRGLPLLLYVTLLSLYCVILL